ncbi:hypothetical protein EI94DRAFT_1729137, partial [Lactarius quietus]
TIDGGRRDATTVECTYVSYYIDIYRHSRNPFICQGPDFADLAAPCALADCIVWVYTSTLGSKNGSHKENSRACIPESPKLGKSRRFDLIDCRNGTTPLRGGACLAEIFELGKRREGWCDGLFAPRGCLSRSQVRLTRGRNTGHRRNCRD